MAELSVAEVVPRWVARYLDLLALSRDEPVEVIGEEGLIFDRPGFAVDFLSAQSLTSVSSRPHYTVLMPVKGYWRLRQAEQISHYRAGGYRVSAT